jgi:hypothetical protein
MVGDSICLACWQIGHGGLALEVVQKRRTADGDQPSVGADSHTSSARKCEMENGFLLQDGAGCAHCHRKAICVCTWDGAKGPSQSKGWQVQTVAPPHFLFKTDAVALHSYTFAQPSGVGRLRSKPFAALGTATYRQ